MDTLITVFQVLLTIFAGAAGLLKLTLPYAKYTDMPGVAWSKDFKPEHIRLIGVLEVSGGVGLIVPLLLGSLTMLTPVSKLKYAAAAVLKSVPSNSETASSASSEVVTEMRQRGFLVFIFIRPNLATG